MGNFSEFGAEESGPRIAVEDQQKWALQKMQAAHLGATGRLANAEAATKEQDLEAQRALGEFYKNQTPAEPSANASPAAPLYDAANFLFRKGFVNAGTAKLKDATLIDQRVTAAGANQARQVTQQLTQQATRLAQHAQMAQAVTDEASYQRYLMQNVQAGEDISDMPPVFDAQAKQMLGEITAQGMKAHDHAKLMIDQVAAKTVDALRKARTTGALAAADASGAHAALLRDRLARAIKNGGENSPEAKELKRSAAAWSKFKTDAARNAALPPPIAQADPKRVYVTQNGIRVRATVDPADGKMKWMHVGGPAPIVSVPTSSIADETPDESDDDEGDE